MPYTKIDLLDRYNISLEDVDATLNACELPLEQDEYTDEEIQSLVDIVRGYFSDALVSDYTAAAEMLKQHLAQQQKDTGSQSKPNKPDRENKLSNSEGGAVPDQLLEISELLTLASSQCGTRITFKEVGQILDSCGLADKDQYTSDEGDRFLEACELIKLQAKSLEEVATHFGIEKVTPPQTPKQLQQLLAEMGELTMLNESDLLSLVERVTLERSGALQGMVSQSYLRNATERFKQDKANTTMLFAELEQRVLDYMEGKRPAQSLRETWDWEPNSLPPSSPKPMSLPEGSLNGTNDF